MEPEIVFTDYGIAALVLLSVSLAANLIPAWHASRVSPMAALRYE